MAQPKNLEKLEKVLEGILFAYGEALGLKKLAEVTKESPREINLALKNLKTRLNSRGIRLVSKNDNWQLVAGRSSANYIEKLIKSEIQSELTPAGLEILAIVAYRGPVSKGEVETVRGVNSSYALRNLTMRGLIEKKENSKPHTYEISLAALRKLGMAHVTELPRYSEFQRKLTEVESLINKI